MDYVPAEQFASQTDAYLDRAIRFNEVVGVRTQQGNAVLISEDEYDALMETVFIMRSERTRQDIMEASAEALEECIAEEDAEW